MTKEQRLKILKEKRRVLYEDMRSCEEPEKIEAIQKQIDRITSRIKETNFAIISDSIGYLPADDFKQVRRSQI